MYIYACFLHEESGEIARFALQPAIMLAARHHACCHHAALLLSTLTINRRSSLCGGADEFSSRGLISDALVCLNAETLWGKVPNAARERCRVPGPRPTGILKGRDSRVPWPVATPGGAP